jgi:SAM-dependent methyltransferase
MNATPPAPASRPPHPTGADVSVIVNVYNEEPDFLAEALRSAYGQTVPPGEVIVVEDGAKRDYASVYAAFPDLKVIRRPNGGLAAARNTGWRAASGDYVAFLDGDDWLMPRAIESNLARFREKPQAGFVFGGYRFVDGTGRPIFEARVNRLEDPPFVEFLRRNFVQMHATVLYRRAVLEKLGGFDEGFRSCEDYDMYLRVTRDYEILRGGDIIAQYRMHGLNMSGDNRMMLDTVLRVLERQKPHADRDPATAAAYRQGIQLWKSYYAGQQLLAAHTRLTNDGLAALPIRDLIAVWTKAPVEMSTITIREIFDRVASRFNRGRVNLGSLDRTRPFSASFGYDRGTPVDRRYIEQFLERHRSDVKGRVLEVGDNAYTLRFGGDRVTRSDVLHVDPDAPNVTYVSDLAGGEGLPTDTFDCVICTQTLHLIYDMPAAMRTLCRILKPGGVLLITVPGVSSVDRGLWSNNWLWSLTAPALSRLVADAFPQAAATVVTYGNVLTAVAFLHGLAYEELRPYQFDEVDPQYPVIVAGHVVKAGGGGGDAG